MTTPCAFVYVVDNRGTVTLLRSLEDFASELELPVGEVATFVHRAELGGGRWPLQ